MVWAWSVVSCIKKAINGTSLLLMPLLAPCFYDPVCPGCSLLWLHHCVQNMLHYRFRSVHSTPAHAVRFSFFFRNGATRGTALKWVFCALSLSIVPALPALPCSGTYRCATHIKMLEFFLLLLFDFHNVLTRKPCIFDGKVGIFILFFVIVIVCFATLLDDVNTLC